MHLIIIPVIIIYMIINEPHLGESSDVQTQNNSN